MRVAYFRFVIFFLILFVTACSPSEEDPVNPPEKKQPAIPSGDVRVSFLAEIIEVHDGFLLVEPNDGEEELRAADRITVSATRPEIFDREGKEILAPKFKEGMELEIVYDGMIKESYPAQMKVYEIHLKSD